MKHWEASQRKKALIFGALLYTLIKAGLPKIWADGWLLALVPALDSVVGEIQTKFVQSVLEGVGLVTLILGAEIAILWWSSRWLLGEWVYQSSAGNWGHVKLSIDKSEGRLQYAVDLFETEKDLVLALRTGQVRGTIGHGVDRLTVHDKTSTRIWYHVPEYRNGERYYPRRQGILTLSPSNQPESLLARWARIGPITRSLDATDPEKRNDINEKDKSNASGSFYFFERRALFEKNYQAPSASSEGAG